MPCLKILTNLPGNMIPKDFVNNIIPLLSKVVKKPEDKFLCVVSPYCQLSFGGESTSPGAVATLESIGNLGLQENKIITKEITEFVSKELGIDKDRFFISFYDIKPQDVGKGGITMA